MSPLAGRFLCLSLTIATAPCLDIGRAHVAVDQPDEWHRWDSSHHGKHFILGAVVGAPTYEVVWLATDSRPAGYAWATTAGLAVGTAYELQRGYDGSAYIDSVDILWTTAGALAGAVTADLTDRAVTAIITPDTVALAWRVEF